MSGKNGGAPKDTSAQIQQGLGLDEQTAALDWLTVTASDETYQQLLADESTRIMSMLKEQGFVQRPWAFKGYEGWTCSGFRYGTRDDGTIVMMSGDIADLNWPVMLSWCNNVTRLDLQVTLTLSSPFEDLAAYYYGLLTIDGTTKEKQPRKLSIVHNNEGGQTFYLGSRASDQYGRVYDKGRESDEALDVPKGKIWRYEVEFKQYRAKRVAQQLLEQAKEDKAPIRDHIAATVYKWYLSRGCAPIWNSDEDYAFAMDISAKVSDDDVTLHWFATQVAPSVQRLMKAGKGDRVLHSLGLVGD